MGKAASVTIASDLIRTTTCRCTRTSDGIPLVLDHRAGTDRRPRHVAVAAGVAVWRIRSLAVSYRGGLIAIVAVAAAAGIGWIVFVSPVYLD